MSDPYSFEIHREDPEPGCIKVVVLDPDSPMFSTETAFAAIGRHVGWQSGEVRKDMTFRFTLFDVTYVVHVTTDDEEPE